MVGMKRIRPKWRQGLRAFGYSSAHELGVRQSEIMPLCGFSERPLTVSPAT
jgi:hypothetical protein